MVAVVTPYWKSIQSVCPFEPKVSFPELCVNCSFLESKSTLETLLPWLSERVGLLFWGVEMGMLCLGVGCCVCVGSGFSVGFFLLVVVCCGVFGLLGFFLQNTILQCWNSNSVKFIFIVVYSLK